jgi:hypothetical protein
MSEADQGAIAAGHSAEERQIAEASEAAQSAEAQGTMATEAAVQANETAEAAAAISVAAGPVAVESADEANTTAGVAAAQAAEAQQEAETARTEVGELREWLSGKWDSLEQRLFPPEEESGTEPDAVEEITLDDTDIGESGNPGESDPESGKSGSTPVHGDNTGEPGRGASETGNRIGGRRFRRGRLYRTP